MNKSYGSKQQGFSVIMIVVIIVSVALATLVGWGVWEKNKKPAQQAPAAAAQKTETKAAPTETAKAITVNNDYFTLTVPVGFTETSERYFTTTGKPTSNYSYINKTTGDYFEVNILKNGGSGLSADYNWYFTDTGTKIVLEKPTTTVCKDSPDAELDGCAAGDGKLGVYVGNKSATPDAKGYIYYFTFGNINTETGVDVSFVDSFTNNLQMK